MEYFAASAFIAPCVGMSWICPTFLCACPWSVSACVVFAACTRGEQEDMRGKRRLLDKSWDAIIANMALNKSSEDLLLGK